MHGRAVEIPAGTLAAIIAPADFAISLILDYLECNSSLLYVCGDYSVILPKFSRMKLSFDVRRAFTSYQLLEILEDADHEVLFIEHAGFEGPDGLIEAIFLAMREVARNGSTVILYATRIDSFADFVARNADRFILARKVNGGFLVQDSGAEFFIGNGKNLSLGDFYGQEHEQR